jgi:phospholipid/cholesterol/gamma-HCH transport system permease protein
MTPRSENPRGPGWTARVEGSRTVLVLTSDWLEVDYDSSAVAPQAMFEKFHTQVLAFDSSGLGRWGSSLLAFLAAHREAALSRKIGFEEAGLPVAARRLLALLPDALPAAPPPTTEKGVVEGVGAAAIREGSEALAFVTLVGEVILGTGAALRHRARMRTVDLLNGMSDAGIAALPMVSLVNGLVGGIVAFVGAVQLHRFGADIYIANLVGVAEVREMAPIMTAIVMAGRTGSAYASEIASMQGSEELDALRVIGIPILDYVVLPRVCALSLMMPLLYLYAGALGILGGFAVGVAMLDLSTATFLAQLRSAVTGTEVLFGLIKSLVFGGWIALAGCRIGLRAGRSSSDVGHAATAAAVNGIAGIIVLDGVFAVCANALGI